MSPVRPLDARPVSALLGMLNAERNEVLHQLKRIEGLSIRPISRLTGVSFNIAKAE